jgi:IPT/TIG domain
VTAGSGPLAGANVVTINGTGFGPASTVSFGSIKATAVTVASSTRLTAKAPAHQAGSFYIHVTTTRGTSPAATGNRYHYVATPAAPRVAAGPATAADNPTSMSCPTSTFCVLVDYSGHAMIYNGTNWTDPDAIDTANHLNGISCPTASWCTAVDDVGNVLTYNSTTWSIPVSIDAHGLNAVSCPNTTFCMAVDSAGFNLAYSGGRWHAPRQLLATGSLDAISCSSTVFCYAVGFGTDADGGPAGGEAVRYASGWQAAHTIDPGELLNTVSCTSPSFCMAGTNQHGVKIYTGAAWSTDITPEFDASEIGGPLIAGLSCVSAQYCHITFWDGDVNTDAAIDGAAVSASEATLNGPVQSGPTSCWAVDKCVIASGGASFTTS